MPNPRLLVVASLLCGSSAALAQVEVVQMEYFGCVSRDYYDRAVKFLVQQDQDAFGEHVARGVMSGQCVVLKKGAKVYLDDISVLSGVVKLRPAGSTKAYWTTHEVIRRR